MLKSTRSKQIITIAAMLAFAVFLFTRDVKGLVKPKENQEKANASKAEESVMPSFTIDEASSTSMGLISGTLASEISALERVYRTASGDDQIAQAKQLAQKWDDVEQTIPSAMYLEVVANKEPSLTNWLNTGTRFLKAFDKSADTAKRSIFLQKANRAFTNAMAIDSTSTSAKSGLGVTIVNGMGAPMQGIALLLEVVKKDPKNLEANMHLGKFALQSGQFDKAIIRFNSIINTIKATPDAYFYLATAYESLGKNKEAVDAYLISKKLAADPSLSKFIDKKVTELKN